MLKIFDVGTGVTLLTFPLIIMLVGNEDFWNTMNDFTQVFLPLLLIISLITGIRIFIKR